MSGRAQDCGKQGLARDEPGYAQLLAGMCRNRTHPTSKDVTLVLKTRPTTR